MNLLLSAANLQVLVCERNHQPADEITVLNDDKFILYYLTIILHVC